MLSLLSWKRLFVDPHVVLKVTIYLFEPDSGGSVWDLSELLLQTEEEMFVFQLRTAKQEHLISVFVIQNKENVSSYVKEIIT